MLSFCSYFLRSGIEFLHICQPFALLHAVFDFEARYVDPLRPLGVRLRSKDGELFCWHGLCAFIVCSAHLAVACDRPWTAQVTKQRGRGVWREDGWVVIRAWKDDPDTPPTRRPRQARDGRGPKSRRGILTASL